MSNEFFNVVRLSEWKAESEFVYYYNPVLDEFGNKEDFFNKDDYDMVIVDASLPSREIDMLFNDYYPI